MVRCAAVGCEGVSFYRKRIEQTRQIKRIDQTRQIKQRKN